MDGHLIEEGKKTGKIIRKAYYFFSNEYFLCVHLKVDVHKPNGMEVLRAAHSTTQIPFMYD